MNGYKYVHLDGSQLFFVGVCGFDIIFFTYYLLSYELDKQNTISDSLFTRPDYAIVLSIALFFRLLGVGLYLYRYQNLRVHWVMVGYLGIFLTAAGWGWLVPCKDNLNHFSGVFVFCFGSALYSVSLLVLAGITHKHLAQVHQGLGIFLLISSGILLLAFIWLWLVEEINGKHGVNEDTKNAYIVEHCAYLIHLLFLTTFFLFHSPDATKPAEIYAEIEAELAYDPEGVALKPLLRPVVLGQVTK